MAGGHRMAQRRARDAGRRALQSAEMKAANQARIAALPPVEREIREPREEHGKKIYVWNHMQTNQVVYSLSQAMRNNTSIRSIPYNGKQTVPAALRKDHWLPLCQITFPPAPPSLEHRRFRSPVTISEHMRNINTLGLLAFQRLREYKRRHELEWDPETMGKDPKTGYFLSKKTRQRKIVDQKANVIADIAAVLEEVPAPQGQEVVVQWSDILDAEYAQTWSAHVVHDKLGFVNNNRKVYVRDLVEEMEEEVEESVAEEGGENVKEKEKIVL